MPARLIKFPEPMPKVGELPSHYVRSAKRRSKQPAKSMAQLRQRELAWILYITEGYIANLNHLLTVNCVTFEDADRFVVENAIATADDTGIAIREALASISKE